MKFHAPVLPPRPLSVALAAALATVSVSAGAVGLSVDIGTTGLGAHVSVPVRPDLNARFGINYLEYSYDTSTTSVRYDSKAKLRTADALLDYFPAGNGFRLTGGVIYNGNRIDAVGRPSAAGTYTINGNTYTAASAGTLNGTIDFRKFAPYLGVGFGNAVAAQAAQNAGRWSFSADLGVMFQGSPSTSLSSSGCVAPAAACAALASDLGAEQRALNDKVNDYRYFPVVRIGANYRF
jgi:hypothetical protein